MIKLSNGVEVESLEEIISNRHKYATGGIINQDVPARTALLLRNYCGYKLVPEHYRQIKSKVEEAARR